MTACEYADKFIVDAIFDDSIKPREEGDDYSFSFCTRVNGPCNYKDKGECSVYNGLDMPVDKPLFMPLLGKRSMS